MKQKQPSTQQEDSWHRNSKTNKLNLNKFHQIKKNKAKSQSLKKKLRDTQRLLNRQNINPDIKERFEKKNEFLQKRQDQEKQTEKKQLRKEYFLEQKYRKIKQVEIKKVARKLRQIQKQIEELQQQKSSKQVQTEIMSLNEQKEEKMKDLNYIKHFPKDKKYVSLFVEDQNEQVQQFRAKLRDDINVQLKQKSINAKLNQLKSKSGQKEKSQLNDPFLLEEVDESDLAIQKKQVGKDGRII